MSKTKYFRGIVAGLFLCLGLLSNCKKEENPPQLPQLPQLSIEVVEVSFLDSLYMRATLKGIDDEDRLRINEEEFGFIILNNEEEPLYQPTAYWETDKKFTFLASQNNIELENDSIKIVAFIRGKHTFYDEEINYADATKIKIEVPLFTHEFDIDNTPTLTIKTGILNDLRVADATEVGHIWIVQEDDIIPDLTLETADSSYISPFPKRFYENAIQFKKLGVHSNHRHLFVRGYVKYQGKLYYGDITSKKLGNFWEIVDSTGEVGCRYGAISFTANGYGYVGLGSNTPNCGKEFDEGSFLNDLWRFDPETEVWEMMSPCPTGGFGLVESVVFNQGNTFYIGLGFSGSTFQKRFYEYYPNEGKGDWLKSSSQNNFNERTRGATAFVIENNAYVGLGQVRIGDTGIEEKKDFYQFAPDINNTTNSWLELTDEIVDKNNNSPIIGRKNATTFSVNGKGYLCCGYAQNANNSLDDVWIFDPSLEEGSRWCKGKDFPGASRQQAVGISDGEYGYIIGGGQLTNERDDIPCADEQDVWRYNPRKDEWEALAQLPEKRVAGIGFALNGFIYVGFGYIANTTDNKTCDTKFYKYIPND